MRPTSLGKEDAESPPDVDYSGYSRMTTGGTNGHGGLVGIGDSAHEAVSEKRKSRTLPHAR